MHVISRDAAASGWPARGSRRKPLSWKTCTWIDRFLYAIVVRHACSHACCSLEIALPALLFFPPSAAFVSRLFHACHIRSLRAHEVSDSARGSNYRGGSLEAGRASKRPVPVLTLDKTNSRR